MAEPPSGAQSKAQSYRTVNETNSCCEHYVLGWFVTQQKLTDTLRGRHWRDPGVLAPTAQNAGPWRPNFRKGLPLGFLLHDWRFFLHCIFKFLLSSPSPWSRPAQGSVLGTLSFLSLSNLSLSHQMSWKLKAMSSTGHWPRGMGNCYRGHYWDNWWNSKKTFR